MILPQKIHKTKVLQTVLKRHTVCEAKAKKRKQAI